MQGPPESSEAAEYYFTYIRRITKPDIQAVLRSQLDDTLGRLVHVSEDQSLHRYEAGKWSIRQLLNHVTDTERVFAYRVLWFSRGFELPLAGFDQTIAAAGAHADAYSWASHLEDFRAVREATLSLFANLPSESWMRGGVASNHPVTVRALAWIIAGHLDHHLAILRDRYGIA